MKLTGKIEYIIQEIEKIVEFYTRQAIRLKENINKLNEKDLSCHGNWSKGYFQGNLSRTEDVIDKLEELSNMIYKEFREDTRIGNLDNE